MIGRFVNVLGDKFSDKISPNILWLLSDLKNIIFKYKVQTAMAAIWTIMGAYWATFY